MGTAWIAFRIDWGWPTDKMSKENARAMTTALSLIST